jgi:hypothetical protein
MGYNCCFFLNFVPLHIESPYIFGGKKHSAEGKWACCIDFFAKTKSCGGSHLGLPINTKVTTVGKYLSRII